MNKREENPLTLLGDYISSIGEELQRIICTNNFSIGEYHYIDDDNGGYHFISIYSKRKITESEQFSIVSSLEDNDITVSIDTDFEYAMENIDTYIYYIRIYA
jgi:hypothetical protein